MLLYINLYRNIYGSWSVLNFVKLFGQRHHPDRTCNDLLQFETYLEGQMTQRDQTEFTILIKSLGTESETNNQNGSNFTKKYSDEGIEMPPYASTGKP